eukprot:TRINITY_DN18733_c0_g1_i1.p1 TRINITY_DN18733_c0_g1~~TRINITY_DN18733_c0_g1_i1.p1  ORF type:complete len:289 (-),score=54.76 TRINITY_DN18733_c0_g1_i1:60-926(-)
MPLDGGKFCGDKPLSEKAWLLGLLIGLYALLVCVCAVSLYRRVRTRQQTFDSRNTWQIWFHAILIVGSCARCGYFAVLMLGESLSPVGFCLNYLPCYLFFTAYFIVLCCWAEIYHCHLAEVPQVTHRLLHRILVVVNVLVYIFLASGLTFYTLVWFSDDHIKKVVNRIFVPVFAESDAVICSATGCYFVVYGALIVHTLCNKGILRPQTRRIFRRVCLTATICTLCLWGRAFLMTWAQLPSWPIAQNCWWFEGLYFIVLELVPLVLMILLLRQNSRATDSSVQRSQLL